MSYIDEALLIDEVADDLVALDDVSRYSNAVDRDIEVEAGINKLRVDEIPVDGSGYVTSRVLQQYGILLFKKYLFMGYWGSSDGDTDIYKEKLDMVIDEIKALRNSITKESILGVFTEEGEPKGKIAVMKSLPIGGRG